jgi:hypothetical protein
LKIKAALSSKELLIDKLSIPKESKSFVKLSISINLTRLIQAREFKKIKKFHTKNIAQAMRPKILLKIMEKHCIPLSSKINSSHKK